MELLPACTLLLRLHLDQPQVSLRLHRRLSSRFRQRTPSGTPALLWPRRVNSLMLACGEHEMIPLVRRIHSRALQQPSKRRVATKYLQAFSERKSAVAPCSWTPQESQVERYEHQDDPNIHRQPFPESVSEEREIYADYDGCHRYHVKRDSYLSTHFSPGSIVAALGRCGLYFFPSLPM
jgi:hypothetical protein